MKRRQFIERMMATGATLAIPSSAYAGKNFKLNYLVASSMYGRLPLDEVLGEVHKTGAATIDIWREKHANQREQIEDMGHEKFTELLAKHKVKMDVTTIWGKPFKDELHFVKKFSGHMVVTGFVPKSDPEKFIETLKPQLAVAEELGIKVAIENHGSSFDPIRKFAEAAKSPSLGVALAPYHLPDEPKKLASLIEDLGPKLFLFYAWQHGMGCTKKLPKEQELMQLPGRGDLDFTPMLAALKKINFQGWTEIFMHPVPRGIPILPTAAETTAEINRARDYLENCLSKA